MQGESETFEDFVRRTDFLSVQIEGDLDDVAAYIGLSRATLFAYRGEKRKIPGKVWIKLEAAERRSGIMRQEMAGMRQTMESFAIRESSEDEPDEIDWKRRAMAAEQKLAELKQSAAEHLKKFSS